MLECLGDSDFLAKLHCIRQAFQVKVLWLGSTAIFGRPLKGIIVYHIVQSTSLAYHIVSSSTSSSLTLRVFRINTLEKYKSRIAATKIESYGGSEN